MNENQVKAITMLQAMIIEADKFHLQVAKALLSSEPLSEQQKVVLRDQIAKRESVHEKQERLFAEIVKLFRGSGE